MSSPEDTQKIHSPLWNIQLTPREEKQAHSSESAEFKLATTQGSETLVFKVSRLDLLPQRYCDSTENQTQI